MYYAVFVSEDITLTDNYVKELSPISYTGSKDTACKIDIGGDFTATYAVKQLADALNSIATQTHALHWKVEVYEASDTGDVLIGCGYVTETHLESECVRSVDPATADAFSAMFRRVASYMVDIVMKILMLKSGISTTHVLKDAEDDSASPTGDVTGESSDLDKLVDAIVAKTKADVIKPKEKLSDYICDETLMDELVEVKHFFENADTYEKLGVDVPKGILFKGAPGTGKTYAARCIAGDTDCYFMVCTASALQGQYVGSGAENIRALFSGAKALQAKSGKGVIVFLDELDSFGDRANRRGGAGGEEDRTLNQLLAELSGFEDSKGIMIIGATNFPERLDDALMRSGRFSRQITIDYPNAEARRQLAEYYFAKIKLPLESCDPIMISDMTESLTPADIKEIANESAILSIRAKSDKITVAEINEAINRVITKNIRRPDRPETDVNLVAAHECGHVLAEVLYMDTTPIKVTNYSYGSAGGFTQTASKLRGIIQKDKFIAEVKTLLAGRAAEQVVCGVITNGASEDLRRASNILHSYYEDYMFEAYEKEKLDQIVLDTIRTLYDEVVKDFNEPENYDNLHRLTSALCGSRVLYANDINMIVKGDDIVL